jgi:hypothetical protein
MGPQPRENPAEEARRLRREIAVRFERLAYLTHIPPERVGAPTLILAVDDDWTPPNG